MILHNTPPLTLGSFYITNQEMNHSLQMLLLGLLSICSVFNCVYQIYFIFVVPHAELNPAKIRMEQIQYSIRSSVFCKSSSCIVWRALVRSECGPFHRSAHQWLLVSECFQFFSELQPSFLFWSSLSFSYESADSIAYCSKMSSVCYSESLAWKMNSGLEHCFSNCALQQPFSLLR